MLLVDEEFKGRHREAEKYFTRRRKLSFSHLIVLMLRKTLKSAQLMLNEFSLLLEAEPVSASAWTQARAHLKHTAFIELNEQAIVEVCYEDDDYQKYEVFEGKAFRLLAIDGSRTHVPNTESVIKEFGEIAYCNDNPEVKGSHAVAQVSVMYDVLNRIALDSRICPFDTWEVTLAKDHLEHTQAGDLLLFDRGYVCFELLAHLLASGRDFVMRGGEGSFKAVSEMLSGQGSDSQLVKLKVSNTKRKAIRELGLPAEIEVRLVRVKLSTGEYEVLITSLLDEEVYRTEVFKELYGLRWGVETFYGILKTRLNLENFSGKSAESVYQDFYSTIYLSGLESLLTADADEQLAARETRHLQQVNRAVSFNAIKNQALDLLFSEGDRDERLQQLTLLFLQNPVSVRKNRPKPRKKQSPRQLLNYARRRRKICF